MTKDKCETKSNDDLTKTLMQVLKMLEEMGEKPKFTAKQFQLVAKVKVTIKGVKKGLITQDKLIAALNELNASLKMSFKD